MAHKCVSSMGPVAMRYSEAQAVYDGNAVDTVRRGALSYRTIAYRIWQ